MTISSLTPLPIITSSTTTVFNTLSLSALHNRLARGKQAFGMAVTLSIANIVNYVMHDFIGRIEAKGTGIANI